MKRNRKILGIIALAILFVAVLFALSSCYTPSTSNGIEKTYINSKGELIITYTNGDTDNLGVVVGKDGADGKDGKDSNDSSTVIGGQNVSLATSKATRSAVSIVSYYEDSENGRYASTGSGVIYKYNEEFDGYFIITNYHVVYDADNGISEEIHVLLYGNEYADGIIDAEYVGGSLNYDIAILFIENNELVKKSAVSCVEVADSNKISIGDTAIAIGNPRGTGISATTGIISVDSENIEMTAADDKTTVKFRVMRTDASVNKGNSGGGLFNDKGQLIGIVNAKTIVDGVEGIGYAIPSTLATNVANNIIDNCFNKVNTAVKRALLGITVSVSESVSVYDPESGKISIKETVYVVEANSTNLFGKDIQANDVIKSIQLDGLEKLEVTRQFYVIDYLLQARVGNKGTLVVERMNDKGEMEEVSLRFTISSESIVNY